MTQMAQIFKYFYCTLHSPRIFYLPRQHSRNRQRLPEDFQKVTLPTPANQCLQFATSYMEKHTFKRNKNDIVTIKILTMLVEATKEAAAKYKTCDFYF